MKRTFPVLFLLLSSSCFSQNHSDKSMTFNLTLDTMLKADYYIVQLSVAEYMWYEGGRKNMRTYMMTLDSLDKWLQSEMGNFGFKQAITKSVVTEVENSNGYYPYRNQEKLFQATYTFNIQNKDSITYLFNKIDKQKVSAMKVTPYVNDMVVERARDLLVAKGLTDAEDYAKRLAASKNQVIVKSGYEIVFYDGGPFIQNYTVYDKKFIIKYDDLNYKITVRYTYSLSDK